MLAAVADAQRIPVGASGVVDLARLEAMLVADSRPALVSVMAANNETGVLQPVAEAAALARHYGAWLHCDAVQWIGRSPFDMSALGVDMATVSGHKIGGPQGVGALAVAADVELGACFKGGGQERGLRAGTENVPGIAGFGVAAKEARYEISRWSELKNLRDRLEAAIKEIDPDAPIHGGASARLPNTSCIGMAGVDAEIQVMAFDLAGICVSAGSACSSGKVRSSHVLSAMGVDAAAARQAIRVSLGPGVSAEEIDRFVSVWRELSRRKRSSANKIPA